MSEQGFDKQDVVDKIRKLLAKAESTTEERERDLFLAKAQELQDKYAVDITLLAAAGQIRQEAVVKLRFCEERNTPLIKAKRELVAWLCEVNRCKGIMGHRRAYIDVYGHESDAEMVRHLFGSIMLQLQTAMARDERVLEMTDMRPQQEMKGWRVSYAHGYVRRVGSRLVQAQQAAQTNATPTAGTPGTALVLADRRQAVERHVAEQFGKLRATRYRNEAHANPHGYQRGDLAGQQADIGGRGSVGGGAGRQELGR